MCFQVVSLCTSGASCNNAVILAAIRSGIKYLCILVTRRISAAQRR